MAYIEVRQFSDGEVSPTVRWRAGGARGGRREFGQQWPPGWIRGQGFVADLRSPDEMFEPFTMRQIGLFTGIQGDTRAKYQRMVEQNMLPWFESYSVRDGEGGISRELAQQWVNDLSQGSARLTIPRTAGLVRSTSRRPLPTGTVCCT